jgi:copper chaperone
LNIRPYLFAIDVRIAMIYLQEHARIEFAIDDMTCGGCVASISRVDKSLDPSAKIDVDVGSKRVKIDSVIPVDFVVATITQAGYRPSTV